MHRPVISIVTPSFNQGSFLEQTIQSVLSQDYEHLEYLVIDGGSSDQSVPIIQKYDAELAYWQSKPDKGQADAIAQGFAKSSGDIMGWLNSDDVLLPGALNSVVDFFRRNPDVEVVSGGAYCIDAEGRPLQDGFGLCTLGVPATSSRIKYYELDGVFQPATFWRRSAYEAVGGVDPSWRFIMDRDLFYRLAERRRFGRLPQLLACFRLHEDCKSVNIQGVREIETQLFNERYGVDPEKVFLNSMIYYRYRIPSVLRKIWLRARLSMRSIRLEAV